MLTNQEIARLCRSMELLIHSGVGLADGIFLLAREEENSSLETMGKMLDRGETLSAAMEASGLFPAYAAALVNIGEETGRTEEALHSLADYFEEKERTRRLIRSAVAYPGMLFGLMLAVLAVLLVKVLPVFDRVYASLGASMTGTAGLLLHLGQLVKGAMPVCFGLLCLLAFLMLAYRWIKPFRKWAEKTWRNTLADRGIARRFNNARFAQGLSMGFGSGLPLEAAAELAENLLSDTPRAARRCAACRRALTEGASIREAMEQLLSPAHSRMLQLGIQSGSADQVMQTIAEQMQEEAETELEELISRIEPAMVLAASLLVGAILLAVLLPLMDILSVLG